MVFSHLATVRTLAIPLGAHVRRPVRWPTNVAVRGFAFNLDRSMSQSPGGTRKIWSPHPPQPPPQSASPPPPSSESPPPPPPPPRRIWILFTRALFILPPTLLALHFGVSITTISGRSMQPTLNSDLSPSPFLRRDVVLLDKWRAHTGRIEVGDVVILTAPHDPALNLVKRVVALEGDVVTPRRHVRYTPPPPPHSSSSRQGPSVLQSDSGEIASTSGLKRLFSDADHEREKTHRASIMSAESHDAIGWTVAGLAVASPFAVSAEASAPASESLLFADSDGTNEAPRVAVVRIPRGHCWVESDEPYVGVDSNDFGPIPMGLISARVSYVLLPLGRFGPVSREPRASDRVMKKDSYGARRMAVLTDAAEGSLPFGFQDQHLDVVQDDEAVYRVWTR
ncbi:peptidase S24/S26A/S26B/S26C [Cladochytrium replicatum]|nr:peptidase S24/S26A/S26B/S26C [Cladochytrium replicatum]